MTDKLVEVVARAMCEDDPDELIATGPMRHPRWWNYVDNVEATLSVIPVAEMVRALREAEGRNKRVLRWALVCSLCDEPNGHLEDCPFAVLSTPILRDVT